MTKDEALRLALEALEDLGMKHYESTGEVLYKETFTAIKAALEAKDEPIKLRRGDILRCIETDELCTVWATSSSGKTLIKWGGNDFTNYTAEQIGELFWIEPKAKDEPVAVASHGVVNWIADKQFQHEADLYTTPPQRTWVGLTEEEMEAAIPFGNLSGEYSYDDILNIILLIQAKLRSKNHD